MRTMCLDAVGDHGDASVSALFTDVAAKSRGDVRRPPSAPAGLGRRNLHP
ncbi:MAG: hypothetical protein R3F59_19875 [Myxococcota bacterium]